MLLILLLALSALAVAATAPPDRLPAAPGWVADRWGTEQGLPSESVYRLAWAPDGRLALGTTMGLGFFDGRSFEFLRVGDPDPPPDDRAMFVLNDAEGGLWVVSESGGLQRRTQAGTTRFQDVPVAPMALHPFVWRGRVFLQGGDALIELGPEPVVNDDFPPGTSMIIARDGVDWLWCTQGPRRWSADSGGWEPVEDASEVPTLWADRDLAGFHQALDGVWLGDDRLLATDEEPAALLVDGSTVWVATRGQGLVRLRPTPITLHPSAHPTLPRADVAIPIGPEGPVWSGAAQGPGFWSVEHPEVRHRRYTFVDPLHAVSEEVVERGHLRLVPIHPPHGGRIWTSSAGTFRETPDSDADTLVLERIPEAPNCVGSPDALLYLDDGRVLLGQGAVTDGRTWTVSPQACQPLLKWPRSVVSLPTGGFLVGGLQGVGRLSPSLELTPVGGPDDLSVRHLRIWDGRIWASTDERGVCVLPLGQLGEAEPAWRCVGRLGGFPENTVHASVHDDLGRVWFSTNTGLWVARSEAVDALFAGTIDVLPALQLGRAWGLDSPELNGFRGFSLFVDPAGHFWFPGQGGLAQVDPERLQLPAQLAGHVVAVSSGGRALSTPVHLPTTHRPLRIELAVSPLEWAEEVALRYRLNEQPWEPADLDILLTALPPGDAVLEVQARLLDDWQTIVELPVHRVPALTERPGFPLFVGLTGLLGGGLVFWVRTVALRRRARDLSLEVDRQTRSIQRKNEALAERAAELLVLNETVTAQAARLSTLDELKSRFVADLAHELRTPLTLVVGSLERLQRSVDPEAADSLSGAHRNVARLQSLIDQLFDLSRLEEGQVRMRAQRLDLAAYIGDIVARFRPGFEASGRVLAVSVASPVTVWADPNLLERVIGNLLSNALRHGEGRTSITLTQLDDRCRVEVHDEGPGVPEDARDRIFERFVQLSSGDTRSAEGAGIGLALVREFTELHGGEFGIDGRAEGVGAGFWVELPAGPGHLSLDDVRVGASDRLDLAGLPAVQQPVTAHEPTSKRPRVLLVEDNAEIRAYMAELLGEHFEVETAEGGQQGLQCVRSDRPDAVVTDVRMPGFDGFSLARSLRSDPSTADIPLMFVSAKTQPEDRVQGLELGQDYLCKPFGAAELIARVRNLVGRAPSEAAPADPTDPLPPEAGHVAAFRTQLEEVTAAGLSDSSFKVPQLARRMGVSKTTLQRRMAELDLPSPGAWLQTARLERARTHLQDGDFRTVGEVAAAVGLSRAYFTRAYRAWAGHPPGQDVRGGRRGK